VTGSREDARRRVAPYDRLKAAILSGELEPGSPLVEVALAEWCGVSRTPIREALRRLQQDGLVQRSDRGLAVKTRSPEEILDIYDARMVLEATTGRVAAERRTDYDVRLLHGLLDHGDRVPGTDGPAMVEANQKFHRAVWRAGHNEALIDLLERLNLHLARYPGTTLSTPGRWATALRQHRELVAAIESRDGDEAYAVATRHFLEARDIRMALFASGEIG
jgi:DNA-binding GntR family transcriptional regulator